MIGFDETVKCFFNFFIFRNLRPTHQTFSKRSSLRGVIEKLSITLPCRGRTFYGDGALVSIPFFTFLFLTASFCHHAAAWPMVDAPVSLLEVKHIAHEVKA